ncbi:siroheme synthase middle domains-like protein [Suhomyces tanzawaensis NRRL Y-17324]|uniref:precorrin-2 dehydrogenase n=1 Tax=Suhomyces tanzawaensis NRRL Y-17324 TaxID=984487 RepID=A0A1E4SIP1_9ASCO|nr:siroheme synthase middle domains-like protein [Suhomyces tanzawaensis NRRL Y-17324]ODV79375.1 siroheme synthase middle domains-like protein [Suhomyces tanzawaensis NRRL Y-17324]
MTAIEQLLELSLSDAPNAQSTPSPAPSKTPVNGSASETKGSLLLAWQVRDKHCLVIGSGEVALSRILHLIRAQAKITVVAGSRDIHPEIVALHEKRQLFKLIRREYQTPDLTIYENIHHTIADIDTIGPENYAQIDHQVKNETFAIVCCCIDDYELSTNIYYQCKYLRLPVNIADKPPMCDFYFGSMFNQENLQIMISTNGKSPRLSKLIKDNIAKEFEGIDLNHAVENLGLIRSRLRETIVIDDDLVSIDTRMNWIKTLTDFFSLKQWSEVDLIPASSAPPYDNRFRYVDNIIKYFPDFPPKDYDEFVKVVCEK